MPTDPTELQETQSLRRYDGGFTQTWDTVGTGIKSHAERAWPSLKRRFAMRLSVRLRGKQQAREKADPVNASVKCLKNVDACVG